MTDTAFLARVFTTIHKLCYTKEHVTVRIDPSDDQLNTEIVLMDIPYASVTIIPSKLVVDGERLVAHPDLENLGVLLQGNRTYYDVVVTYFEGEMITEMGEAGVELHLEMTEDSTTYFEA